MPNRVGANGARIVPGNSETSRLYLRVSAQAGLQMPPTGALPPDAIPRSRLWIDQGAEWPDELAGEMPSPPQDPAATKFLDAIRRGDRASCRAAAGAITGGGACDGIRRHHAVDVRRALWRRGIRPACCSTRGRSERTQRCRRHRADVGRDNPEITRLLLERAADPNLRSADGRSALMLAAGRCGATDVVKALLDAGATFAGQPVLPPAADAGDPAIIRMLLDRGAGSGTMPADLAMRSGCEDCVRQCCWPGVRRSVARWRRRRDTATREGM